MTTCPSTRLFCRQWGRQQYRMKVQYEGYTDGMSVAFTSQFVIKVRVVRQSYSIQSVCLWLFCQSVCLQYVSNCCLTVYRTFMSDRTADQLGFAFRFREIGQYGAAASPSWYVSLSISQSVSTVHVCLSVSSVTLQSWYSQSVCESDHQSVRLPIMSVCHLNERASGLAVVAVVMVNDQKSVCGRPARQTDWQKTKRRVR